MNVTRTLLSGIMGTTTMTLFSYAVSQKRRKQFKEPVLLHKFVQRISPGSRKKNKGRRIDGWLLHYVAGFLFSTVYDQIWKESKLAPTIPEGIVLGAVSGLAGISIWDITFRIHPDPPEVDKKEFYKHLITAHVLFGLFAALGYRSPEAIENKD